MTKSLLSGNQSLCLSPIENELFAFKLKKNQIKLSLKKESERATKIVQVKQL